MSYEKYARLHESERRQLLEMFFDEAPIIQIMAFGKLDFDAVLLIGAVIDDLVAMSKEAFPV